MADGSNNPPEVVRVGEYQANPPTLSPNYQKLSDLPNLQELTRAGFPRPLIKLAEVYTSNFKRSLNQTGEFALNAFKTDLNVEGKAHSGSTIFVLNHPLWVEDLFFLTKALGDKTRNLKVLVTQEMFLVIPPNLRHHFIPVDTGLHERRAQLKGAEKAVTDVLHKVLPNSPLREAGRRNKSALQIAAEHVASGGDVAIFEERDLDDLVAKTDKEKLWFSGVGSLVERTQQLMPEGKQAFVQMMAIEFVQGNKKNLLARKKATLTIADPIELDRITVGLPASGSRKQITRRIQGLFANTFRYRVATQPSSLPLTEPAK